jgi:hypothetical protein
MCEFEYASDIYREELDNDRHDVDCNADVAVWSAIHSNSFLSANERQLWERPNFATRGTWLQRPAWHYY